MTFKRPPSALALVVLTLLVALSLVAWRVIESGVDRQERDVLRQETSQAALLLQRSIEHTSLLLGSVGVGAKVFDANAHALRSRPGITVALVTKGRADAQGNVTPGPARTALAVGPDLEPGDRLGKELAKIASAARSDLSASPVIRLAGRPYVVYSIVPPAIGLPGYVALELRRVVPARVAPTIGPNRRLELALYATPTPRAGQLISSSVGLRALPRPTAWAPVDVGSVTWVAVGAARAPLLNRRVEVTPWIVLGVGLVLAFALAITVETLGRRQREQRLARRAAEQSADAARALAHVREAVILTNTEGLIRYRNHAAAAWFALPDGEFGSDTLSRVVEELGSDDRGGPQRMMIDGEERWLTCTESRFDGGAVLVFRDVTDDHRLEALRSDFVATAAHELRTPLAAVYGAVRTIRRHELSSETRETFLALIESESQRLKDVTDQLLASAQLDAETLQLTLEAVDAVALGGEVLGASRARKPERLELTLEKPESPVWLQADPSRLRQVLANLLDNAIKYSPDGGRIELSVAADGAFGVIRVADQGIGIPIPEQQRIFEKFYRLDPNMTRGVGGSGLGLHISRELIHQMGGELTVTSHHGVGSIFSVSLPLATPRGDGDAASAESRDFSLADT